MTCRMLVDYIALELSQLLSHRHKHTARLCKGSTNASYQDAHLPARFKHESSGPGHSKGPIKLALRLKSVHDLDSISGLGT